MTDRGMMAPRAVFVAGLILSWILVFSDEASAGLSAENVIVVVNADSYNSRTLANHYVQYRNIPSSNVILLGKIPDKISISLDTFRNRILKPVLTEVQTRGLAGQARVIAYSAGFPTTVDISRHAKRLTNPTLKKIQRGRASINGATFFYRFIMSDDHRYLDLASNAYCRGPFNRNFSNPFADPERRAEFSAADKLFDIEDYKASADLFEKLFAASPRISPLALRAAEARVRAGDQANAKQLIVKAVAAGWTSKKWFQENDTLAPLMDQAPISSLSGRLSDQPIDFQEPIGFSSQSAWTPSGYPISDPRNGVSYMLSCMLGVIHPRGSDINQAVQVLKRAAPSDQTEPDGVFWFAVSKDVRTKTRLLQTLVAVDWLDFLGEKNESPFGAVPKNPGNVIGLMLGTPTTKIATRKWSFVPGAIADNLTSHGGNYSTASQSKLNVLLHAGAAMSSGTVTEPYAIQAKFPLPMMYGYYASGAAALEAFYLSVASPYQLLIVGDPLTQPFSRPPMDRLTMLRTRDSGSAVEVTRTPPKTASESSRAGAAEIYLNGKLAKRVPAVPKLNLNLPDNLVGSTEIRTVLISGDLLQARRSHVSWIDSAAPALPTVSVTPGSAEVQVQCSDASSIELVTHNEVIGSIDGTTGDISIAPKKYGGGPLRVRPVAKVGDQTVAGRPVYVSLPVVVEPFPKPKPKPKT